MPAPDPIAKLEDVLIARGMMREDIPGFIERYAKLPVLRAAQELQQRGIHYEIAYLALAKLEEPKITRESTLDEGSSSSAVFWTFLALASFGAGLWTLKHSAITPWLEFGLFGLGIVFSIGAISKWID
jgi:hypothetical protein